MRASIAASTSRIDGNRKGERKRRRDDSSDVRHEPEHGSQDTPQNGTGDAYDPQACANDDAEDSIQKELEQEKLAKATRSVVKCGRRSLQIA